MSSCFVSECKQVVEYLCKCKSPPVHMCLSHMGTHYGSKCGQAPIHIDTPSASPIHRSLQYLSEVRTSVLLTSNTLINLIKSETTKMLKTLQQEETLIKKCLISSTSLSQSEKTKLESRKFFNIRGIQDDLLQQTYNFLSSAHNSICSHLLLQYRLEKEPKITWTPSIFPEMFKYEAKFSCSRCGEAKINQELFPNDSTSVCLICSGTKPGCEIVFAERDPPPPPQGWGPPPGPPPHGWGPPPGPPPQAWGPPPGGHHGGRHGHGKHGGPGKEWKHKKHHYRGEMTYCPPHVRPRCEYS